MAGSLQNLLYDNASDSAVKGELPKVGDGATLIHWTDRDAYTVIEVSATGHQIVIQEDKAIRTDKNGMSDAQSYRFERNEDGRRQVATRRKDGGYRLKGYGKNDGGRVLLGARQSYYDYSF